MDVDVRNSEASEWNFLWKARRDCKYKANIGDDCIVGVLG
jgi:hypothetical protein